MGSQRRPTPDLAAEGPGWPAVESGDSRPGRGRSPGRPKVWLPMVMTSAPAARMVSAWVLGDAQDGRIFPVDHGEIRFHLPAKLRQMLFNHRNAAAGYHVAHGQYIPFHFAYAPFGKRANLCSIWKYHGYYTPVFPILQRWEAFRLRGQCCPQCLFEGPVWNGPKAGRMVGEEAVRYGKRDFQTGDCGPLTGPKAV